MVAFSNPAVTAFGLYAFRPRRLNIQSGYVLMLVICHRPDRHDPISGYRLSQQNTVVHANVTAGAQGGLNDVTPTTNEINRASSALGTEGYIAYLACSLLTAGQTNRARELSTIADELNLRLRVYDGTMTPTRSSPRSSKRSSISRTCDHPAPARSRTCRRHGGLAGAGVASHCLLNGGGSSLRRQTRRDKQQRKRSTPDDSYATAKLLAGSSVPEILTFDFAPPIERNKR